MKKTKENPLDKFNKEELEKNAKRNTLLNSIVLFERAYSSMIADLEDLNGNRDLIEENWDETIELFTKKLFGDIVYDGVTQSTVGYQILDYFEMFKEKDFKGVRNDV